MVEFAAAVIFLLLFPLLIYAGWNSAPYSGLTHADIARQNRQKAMEKSRREALIEAKTEYYRAKAEALRGKTDGV